MGGVEVRNGGGKGGGRGTGGEIMGQIMDKRAEIPEEIRGR
jgi:hypothetical protein